MFPQKNVKRKHYIAPYVDGGATPAESAWLPLGDGITDISDSTDEQTDDKAYYSGDGTVTTRITGIAGSYDFSGDYLAEDPAQALIEDMKYKLGAGRKVWHRVIRSDGKKQWVGHATVSGIVAGSGAAETDEEFACSIKFDQIPIESAPGGASAQSAALNSAIVDETPPISSAGKNSKKEDTK